MSHKGEVDTKEGTKISDRMGYQEKKHWLLHRKQKRH